LSYKAGDPCPFCSKEGKKGRLYPTGKRDVKEPVPPPQNGEIKAESTEFECDTCHRKPTVYGRDLNA
jgi:hypothetical protein